MNDKPPPKAEIEELLERARFRKRLWEVIRRWAAWLTAIIVGAPTVLEAMRKLWAELHK